MKASLPGYSIAFVAQAEGLPQSTMWGFIKYKETGRKFYSWKQLESNPQGQDSYANKSSDTFLWKGKKR